MAAIAETKKDIDYYMDLDYEVKIERDPNGEYFATVPDLPGCMATAESESAARVAIEDAKYGWFKVALESNVEIKEPPVERRYSGRILFRTSPVTHMNLVEEARENRLTLNAYLNMLLMQNRCLLAMKEIKGHSKDKELDLVAFDLTITRHWDEVRLSGFGPVSIKTSEEVLGVSDKPRLQAVW